MATDYRQFTDAILQGANEAGPASSISTLSDSMAGKFRVGAISKAAQGYGAVAAQNAEDDRKAKEAARQAQIRALQDSMDPSKYQKRRKDDGGFAFFSPDGKEIDIDTFAKRTGERRADILKDSENPIDQQYIHDWSTMNDITQAAYEGDTGTIDALKTKYPNVFQENITPQTMAEKLMRQYPHIYGKGSYEETYKNLNKPIFNFPVYDPAAPAAAPTSKTSSGGWVAR